MIHLKIYVLPQNSVSPLLIDCHGVSPNRMSRGLLNIAPITVPDISVPILRVLVSILRTHRSTPETVFMTYFWDFGGTFMYFGVIDFVVILYCDSRQ